MPWNEDESLFEGRNLKAALRDSYPDAIVMVEVDFAELEGYSGGRQNTMAFFQNGTTVERLLEYMGGQRPGEYFTELAEERAEYVRGPRKYRLFYLDEWPRRTEEGRSRRSRRRR